MSPVTVLDVIRVQGGARLAGEVQVSGAKNSALKLMAAALLAEGRTVLHNVPQITDIAIMAEVLRRLGCDVAYRRAGDAGHRRAGRAGHRDRLRPGPAAAGVDLRARAAAGPVRPGPGGPPGR